MYFAHNRRWGPVLWCWCYVEPWRSNTWSDYEPLAYSAVVLPHGWTQQELDEAAAEAKDMAEYLSRGLNVELM